MMSTSNNKPDDESENQTEPGQRSNDIRWMLAYELRAATALLRGDSAEQIMEGHTSPLEKAYHLARYDYAAHFVNGRRVLDFACGTGYGAQRLAQAKASTVMGADIDAGAIRYSTLRYSAPNLSFRVVEPNESLPARAFDVAVSFETIEHVSDPEGFVTNLAQSLTTDGRAFFSTPIRWNGTLDTRPSNPFHIREWSVEEFRDLLSRHFHLVEPILYQGGLPRRQAGAPNLKQIARYIKRRVNGLQAESILKLQTALKPAEAFDLTQWSRPTYMVVPCSSPR